MKSLGKEVMLFVEAKTGAKIRERGVRIGRAREPDPDAVDVGAMGAGGPGGGWGGKGGKPGRGEGYDQGPKEGKPEGGKSPGVSRKVESPKEIRPPTPVRRVGTAASLATRRRTAGS